MSKPRIMQSLYQIRTPAHNRPHAPVRIVFVTDVHNCRGGLEPEAIAQAIESASPDVILSGGDLITARHGEYHGEKAERLLELMCKIAPVYIGEGNHESRLREHPDRYGNIYENLRSKAQALGAVWLSNEQRELNWNGMKISLDAWNPSLEYYDRFHPKTPKPQVLSCELGKPRKDVYHILMAHHPDFFSVCAKWGADLTLSGHFHGGIIRLPVLGGVCGGSLQPFPEYDRGKFELDEHNLIVSSGLGLHTIPLRFNNPFELAVIDLI